MLFWANITHNPVHNQREVVIVFVFYQVLIAWLCLQIFMMY